MNHRTHEKHDHVHADGCGHLRVRHGDHDDYLHDGHLHFVHGDHVDEHELEATEANPASCRAHDCSGHAAHAHGPGCGHASIPHAGHVDYIVDGHLHHPHDGHCDHHGDVKIR